MKLHRLGLVSVALTTALIGMSAQAVTGIGSINHDIKFGGVISSKVPVWKWSLPSPNTRLDLKFDDATTSSGNSSWNILQNKVQPISFLNGYMEATVPGQALMNLNPEVSYLQNATVVVPTVEADGSETLNLEATGNQGAINTGALTLKVQPVLLVATGDTATLTMQSYSGVSSPDTNASVAYSNAKIQLESQLSSTNATSVVYSNAAADADFLQDGKVHTNTAIAGYASAISAGHLSFPEADAAALVSWQSVVTVQVAYK